jgi:hypothetical protein
MLEVDAPEPSELHPFRNQRITLFHLSKAKLFLGIAYDPVTTKKWIIIYTKNENDNAVNELDVIQQDLGTKESNSTGGDDTFHWGTFQQGGRMTREQAKERLKMLGFSPSIMDEVFPPRLQNAVK